MVGPSLVSAWSGHRLEDVGVGAVSAGRAEKIALEVRQRLLDLGEILPPDALPAAVAHAAPLGNAGSGHDVRAMLVRSEAPALAAVAANTDAHFVQSVRLGAGGDDVAAAALVGVEDLVCAKLVNAEAAQDVGGSRFGGGGVLHLRYSGVDHGGSFPVVRAPGVLAALAGAICVMGVS